MVPLILAHPRTLKQLEQYSVTPAHAVGLYGEHGAGKGFAAVYLCAKLLGADVGSIGSHPYVLRIDALAAKAGIDDIRSLQQFLTLTVPGTKPIRRAVILEHLDTIGYEGQTALLKTLEEPPADTIIAVTYSQATRILPTIHSRLQSVQILPVSLPQAENYFNTHGDAGLNKSFLISGGLAGMLVALRDTETDHPLVTAINEARKIIGLSRYQRLGIVDKLSKNDKLPIPLLLDGLYRLVEASYRQSLKTKSNSELKGSMRRLSLIEQALNDIDKNIQTKLVLSRLFMEL